MKNKILGIMSACAVVGIISGFIYFCVTVGSYPMRFEDNLNVLLGEGNWEHTETERNRTSLLRESTEYGDSKGSYKKWYIAYKDEENNEQLLILNNLTHKVSAQNRSFFDSQYVNDEKCFGMNIYDEMVYLAEQDVYNTILEKYFSEDEFKYQNPKYNGLSVRVAVDTVNAVPNDFYQNICDSPENYYLPSFSSNNYMELQEIEPYISISIQSCNKNKKEILKLDETVSELVSVLCDRYPENANFEILVSHYENEEAIDEDGLSYGYFYWNGEEISYEDIVAVCGEEYPNLAEYVDER